MPRTLFKPLSAALLLAALSGPAAAEAPPAFVRLRDAAKPVDSLGSFLDRYVGNCPDLLEKAECTANAKKARAQMTGRSYYLILDQDFSRLLQPAGFNPVKRELRVDLTPFFDAAGLALTEGQPLGLDSQGRPRIPLISLQAKVPDSWMPMDMERLIKTGNVRIHLVFKPLGQWSLAGKGRAKLEGVKAKLQAVRLTHARKGDDIALWIAD